MNMCTTSFSLAAVSIRCRWPLVNGLQFITRPAILFPGILYLFSWLVKFVIPFDLFSRRRTLSGISMIL